MSSLRLQFTTVLILSAVLAVGAASKINSRSIDHIDSLIQYLSRQHELAPDLSHAVVQSPDKTQPVVYEFRLASLDEKTPIKLDYNKHVQKYIDHFLTTRRNDFAVMAGLSTYYFPIFESYLDKYQLPLELKYLAVIESGLDPQAVSKSGAVGLWQFLFNTSRMFDLEVNSYIDQRCDVYKSTESACKYLKYLHTIFNDWQLALAAYNGGPGEVRNAMIRSGGKTSFWELQPYLPEQTKWYVPAFIAAVYVMNHYPDHGLVSINPNSVFEHTDTLLVSGSMQLEQIARAIDMPGHLLRLLNPVYRKGTIPAGVQSMPLVLPADKVSRFLKNEQRIIAQSAVKSDYFANLGFSNDTTGKKRFSYTVAKGDFLHKIAFNNNCTVDNLRLWNKLKSDQLAVGQVLYIWTENDVPDLSAALPQSNIVEEDANDKKTRYYVVRKGDTIGEIVNKYKGVTVSELKKANKINNEKDLKPGQKLVIP